MPLLDYLFKTLKKLFKKKSFRKSKPKKKTSATAARRKRPGQTRRKSSVIKKTSTSLKKRTISSSRKPKALGSTPLPRKTLSQQKSSNEVQVGEITHYFPKIQVAVLKMLNGRVHAGDQIRIIGKKTDFIQKVNSLQIESRDVREAVKGQLAGLKVDKIVQVGDKVMKLSPKQA